MLREKFSTGAERMREKARKGDLPLACHDVWLRIYADGYDRIRDADISFATKNYLYAELRRLFEEHDLWRVYPKT